MICTVMYCEVIKSDASPSCQCAPVNHALQHIKNLQKILCFIFHAVKFFKVNDGLHPITTISNLIESILTEATKQVFYSEVRVGQSALSSEVKCPTSSTCTDVIIKFKNEKTPNLSFYKWCHHTSVSDPANQNSDCTCYRMTPVRNGQFTSLVIYQKVLNK